MKKFNDCVKANLEGLEERKMQTYLYEIHYCCVDLPTRKFIKAENDLEALIKIYQKEFEVPLSQIKKLSEKEIIKRIESQEDCIYFILNTNTLKYVYEMEG